MVRFRWFGDIFHKYTLKWKCRHFYEIFISGCTGCCQNDNFQYNKWLKFCQNDNILCQCRDGHAITAATAKQLWRILRNQYALCSFRLPGAPHDYTHAFNMTNKICRSRYVNVMTNVENISTNCLLAVARFIIIHKTHISRRVRPWVSKKNCKVLICFRK